MKTFVAIPCMESVNTMFFQCVLSLDFSTIGAPKYGISRSSLIYDARNALVQTALKAGAERILWLDSDMIFNPDIALRLSEDMDEGREFVSGLCFRRQNPIAPTCYCETGYSEDGGKVTPYAITYNDYPKNGIFEVAACGLAACMMSAELLQEVWDAFGAPFSPIPGFGEDISFCRRVEELGVPMYCDSRIKVGHVAHTIVNEESYLNGVVL